MNQEWKNKIYKLGKVDDRIPKNFWGSYKLNCNQQIDINNTLNELDKNQNAEFLQKLEQLTWKHKGKSALPA